MLDWASGELYSENFDAVIHLKFDELKCISEETNLKELLSWSCILTLNQISEILETPEKVLYLIDGMDEFSFNPHIQISSPTDPSQKGPIMDILHCLLRDLMLLESSVIVTTRYTAAAELSNLFNKPLCFTEIVGFSERGVQEYLHKFLQGEQLFRKANEILLTACSVPLLCWMVFFCLEKHFTGSDHVMRELKTTTSIYVHFVSTLLEHHDQSQFVLTMLRSLGQLAEEGVKKRQVLFDEKSVSKTGLDFLTNVFLYKVMTFLCGLFNEKASSSLFKKMKSTVPHTIKLKKTQLKKKLMERIPAMTRQYGLELFALHCLYELQDERFVREALKTHNFMDLSNVSLRSTDSWVLLYCLQCCPHIRDLNLMYCDLTAEKLNLKLVILNESWGSVIISLVQSCTSLQELRRKCSKPTEENQSHICNEEVEIHFKPKVLEKLEESAISKPSSSGLNLHLLPVCQFCVHIVDPDQWVQVEPSVCTDEGGSEFRISTPAGRFECSRTRMRWVCAGDVTLQYRAVDGRFLRAELERLQCERIGPVTDVTVISGKLEEAHLPHYTCLAESDPSLTDAVKLLTKRDEGISLQSVKLTRYHAKIVQPSFSLTTLIMSWFIKWEEHCNLLLYMRCDCSWKHMPPDPDSKVAIRHKKWSDIIVQYKASVIDKCKVATEYNLPCVDLTACYTEPVIIQRSKRQNEKYYCEHVRSVDASSHLLSNDKNHSIRIEQFFSPDCDGNKPKSVILRGDSGMGKSFMLQKIMLDWASGELYSEIFDVMFLFKCEELKCVSGEMNLFELLSWSCSLTSDQISQILELTQEKVLILIDGIDEYVSHPPSHSMLLLTNPSDRARPMDILRSVLKGILLSESFMLVTTRSIADDAVMNLLKGPQRFTEIVGFSERGVQEYFQKFFQDEKLFRKTYKSLKSNESLLTACSVPLPCWMVCFCLEKHFTDGDHVMRELKTNTSIYVHFVSTLLEHHDQSQSVLTMLRSLGQRAEEGMTKREGLFVKKSLTVTGLNPATNVFLHKDSLKRNNRQVPVFKFIHLSFQEFFTGLYYVLLDEEESWGKVRELLISLKSKRVISRPSPEKRSNPIPSVMMFLCGLLNEKASSSLFKMIEWTVPQKTFLKTKLQESVLTMRRQHGCELFALNCLYELQDEEFVRRALGDRVSMDLSNVSLRSTDCWVLLYCLQCCPHIRDLDLMYCDLTTEKLKILQPALCMCETMRLSVEQLSEVGDLIQNLGESKILRELKVQENENSAESLRWSLNLSITCGDVLLSSSSSEKNQSFPAILNISLTCPQPEISSTDWTLFLQRLSKAVNVAEDSSALNEYVSLLMSSFHSMGMKTLDLKLVSLNESWASGIISLVQTCTSLQQLSVCADLLLEEGIMLLKKSLTDPHCTVIIEGKCSKPTDQCKEHDCNHSCCDKVKIHFRPKVLEEQKKLKISEPESSGLNLHPLPVCQSCVHIVDSDQWVQVEALVCTDEEGSEFRISTPAGRFECIRTRMRWVCAGDVTLQYRAVDGRFLSGELERRIGPVIDVKMISGKLEEAHLPHYACLEKSYPSLTDAVKVVSIKDEEVFLKSVELTRFHAKILQPSFGPTTVIKEKGIPVEQHLDLLIFMTNEDPLILHVYFLPLFDTFSKEKIEQEETANNALEIEHPSPSMKIQMDTLHVLKVSGATVLPEEQITFLISIHPIFFKIKQDIDGDVQMTLIKEQHEMFVWKTIIWKDKLNQKKDLMAKLSTEMSKHNLEGQKRKPQKGWSDIILHYKASVIDKCKFVTECNLPSDERVELAGLYTEPVMIQKSKEQIEKYYRQHVRSARASGSKPSSQLLSNDKNHSIKIDQLFSPDSDGNTPKTVILSGDSGRGKSFMLQKIMVDWAFGKLYYRNFDIIFLLNCEELKCISEEMSLSELLSWSCSLRSDQISQILELKPEKVLILIDGIDEYIFHHPSHSMLLLTNLSDRARPMDILRSVSKGILLHESFILVTTRSIAADAVMNLLKGPQRFTEIMGFSEKGVQEYFQKFFQDEKLFRKTYESRKINETTLTACSVPLLCWMVCFCLKKHFGSDHVMRELKTTTSIYVHFVSTLLEHHDQSQSVLTMLRSLGQRAEEGVKRREGLFVENSLTVTGLNPATNVFLHKDSLKRNNRQVPVFKFMHFSFQEFFTGLYYVLLDKEQSWRKVKALLNLTSTWSSPERRSNPSVMMFLCGLLNEKVSSSLFEMIKWTVPHTRKLKTSLSETVLTMRRQNGYELFALHCLYELQNEEFVKKALGDWVTMDLSNISLRSTDCWVLLYCLQCCPHIRDLDLTYCDLTSEKLKILQPALSMCETMRLSVEHLSEVGDLIQILGKSKFLKKMRVQESENSAGSPRWSLNLSVTHGDVLLSLNSSVKNPSFPAILNISLTCPKSEISNTDWTLFLQRLSKARKIAEDSSALDEHVRLLLSSFLSVGLKTLNLKLVSLNESWASGIIFLAQTCTSLQELGVSVSGLLLEDGLMLLEKSLTDPHCTVIIEGRKCSKPTDQCKEQDWSYSCNEKVKIHFKPKVLEKLEELTRSEPKPSGLNLYPLPVCQSCVHIVDSDQWVQVEPSVCTDKGGSEFRISTPAGRFECSRTRMQWVCAGDVTLQYRAVDGRFLRAELERLQCERIGPVTDVTVISGKLEEAHLPHYACLAESDPSLKNNVRLLSKSDEGISLQSVELTRYHAKIVQPSFSIITLILSWFIKWEEHCDLLLFMQCKDPLFLHIYFFPVNDTCSKEKVEQNEKSSLLIRHPRPDRPFQLKTPHLLEVPGASVQPEEGISFRTDIDPNFFMVRKQQHGDVQINLIREVDKKSVWKATIWKEKFGHLNPRLGESSHEEEEQKPSKETQFVDRNYAALIQRVSSVKAIADELKNNGMIHHETLSEIKAEQTNQDKMRKLFEALNSGGDTVKNTFYYALKNQEPSLFRDLGGDN
ncbi:hypothetical protein QQF64_015483 [Cirrhinus molitorella]|uniref:NACHT domain-containing protein n=1 Tax=Cirrhinus molitorella TaxID=172907 RepID=A0ABR3NW19_9TELE